MNVRPSVPLCVYLIFHPDSPEAPRLAEWVFRWLRFDGEGTMAGLPVYYRAALVGKPAQLTPKIEFAQATHNFLVPLVDDHLAVSDEWRAALAALLETPEGGAGKWFCHVLPVMLDRSFDQLGHLFGAYNPLRVFAPDDPAAPGPEAVAAVSKQAWQARVAARGPRLRRHLTEAMVRELRSARLRGYAESRGKEFVGERPLPERLRVFISHAKRDGEEIALRIRDELASVSQLVPWFDVNDLAAGHGAAYPMSEAAAGSSGGMIAVVTDAYSTRPWCRFEAECARRPRVRPAPPGADAGVVNAEPLLVEAQPIVVVHSSGGSWSRGVGPLAQVHRIGWSERPGLVAEVVDRLLMELLLAEVNRAVVDAFGSGGGPPSWPSCVFLNFIPDAWQLAELAWSQAGRIASFWGKEFVYPGHRLRPVEHEELRRVLQVAFSERARLSSLEAFVAGVHWRANGAASDGRLIGLSAGGVSRELYRHGIGEEHLDDLTVRLTRALLDEGFRVGYGGAIDLGALAGSRVNLTRALLASGEGWRSDRSFSLEASAAERSEQARHALANPPLVSFVRSADAGSVTTARRAEHLGLCEFRVVGSSAELGVADSADREAAALRELRKAMAEACAVRVLYGGKVHGFSGWLPGVAEELLACIEADKPYLIVGQFGGCARLLSDYLLERTGWPMELTYDQEVVSRAGQPGPRWGGSARRYRELRRVLASERKRVTGATARRALRGVPLEAWRAVAESSESATELIARVLSAIAQCKGTVARAGLGKEPEARKKESAKPPGRPKP